MEPNKRAPAFQLYPQDFISSLDVQMMSAAEVGAYCLLLFNSWTQPRQGYLPNDEALLHFMTRLTPEQWKQSKKRLLGKFQVTPDKKYRYNARLVSEADKHSAFRERQAENGKRGGRPRRDEAPPKPPLSSGQTQKNPGLSQPLEVANPTESSSTSSSFSSSTSSSEEPLPSVGGAGSELEDAEPWLTPLPESPAPGSAHQGGAADVGTSLQPQRGGRWQYDPAAIASNLLLPFDTPEFRQQWVAYRAFREEDQQRQLTGGMQEQELLRKLSNLAGGSQQKALDIIAQTIAKGWKDLYKLDEQRPNHTQPGQPERGAKPTAAASTGARALSAQLRAIREERGAQAGSYVDTGAAAGTNAGLGPAVPPGVGAPQGGRG